MTKWEYNEWEFFDDSDLTLLQNLNYIGALGWDVFKVSNVILDGKFKTQILAKRCISPNETTNSLSPTTPVSY
jgi:hypothetical protein